MRDGEGTTLILDAGSGIRRLSRGLSKNPSKYHILLTHLHMDHIMGLGFFEPLFEPDVEVHIWGPAGVRHNLRSRLSRYMSPPLFPVHLGSLPCNLYLHEIPSGDVDIGSFHISSAYVCHPGHTVGFRIESPRGVVTYIPDHEPALGVDDFPSVEEWTSGFDLAREADILIHDAQYTHEEYPRHLGWGHSSVEQAIAFGELTGVRRLVPFHHDPTHSDDDLDRFLKEAIESTSPSFDVTPGIEETVFEL